ncbi:hypothetical protein [Piscinibacter sp.]|uniref:hypothetical protein n=1 Tax=Piscinibacter sp. TaxID=1903157 RepID=UPI002B5B3BAB|nr:hypothetical protein [Albitalea sp.]HUG24272.1 hypothetical protein [Albitalea sp.]
MKSILSCLAAALLLAAPMVGSAAPTDFPPEATPVSDDALRERLSGKVFSVMPADGNGWRLEYKSNGYFFINTDKGFAEAGRWKTESGKLCSEAPRIQANCSEVRVKGDALYLKRASTGEVVEFVVR